MAPRPGVQWSRVTPLVCGVLCAMRQVGRTWFSHPEVQLSALLSTCRSHAHRVRTREVHVHSVLLEVTPADVVEPHAEWQATQSRDRYVQETNSTLSQPPCLWSSVLQQLSPSPPAAPRLSYALHGSLHGSQAPSSPQPLAGIRTPLGPHTEGNLLQASDSLPTARALPISLVVALKPPSLCAPAKPL